MAKRFTANSGKPRTKTPEQALKTLMDQCAKAEKSTWHVKQSLYRWGIRDEQQAGVITTLTEHKFIDDERYAMAFAREKTALSRWGIYKIRTALQMKQIPSVIIERALAEIDTGSMREKLEVQLAKKLRSVKAKTAYDLKGKLLRYGTGLGFGYEEVAEAVDRLVRESDLEFEE